MPFRPQDWSRLKKIAEGNPDESKIGAFGVGAYTMFSICEEPLVISGSSALAFVWKGDALYTKTSDVKRRNNEKDNSWTSFILPSRDPYPLPNLTEFGEFLCASLTFTKSLSEIRVYVNDKLRLNIVKTLIQDPTPVEIQKNSSWWRSDGAITASPNGIFSLKDTTNSFLESFYHIQVTIDGENAAVTARYLSALAKTNISAAMTKRMERVTKKRPPSNVEVHIFLSGQFDENSMKKRGNAYRILESFSPSIGEGRIFIGFRTSQTTGVAAHLHAPFVPTVEREAMDLQDQALRTFNLELLQFSGILMRLTLEHGMNEIGMEYNKGAKEREQLDEQFLKQEEEEKRSYTASQENNLEQELDASNDEESVSNSSSTSALFGFAKYMAQTVKKKIVSVKTKMEEIIDFEGGELLHPRDPRPLCQNESKAIILMQSFCPRQSTPDPLVGTSLAQGFSLCFNNKSPPVLTRVCGVIPGEKARLPNKGIEGFCKDNVVRSIVYENAKEYHDFVANCQKLNLQDLKIHLKNDVLKEKELVRFMKWWVRFTKIHTHNISSVEGAQIKDHIRFTLDEDETSMINNLQNFLFYTDEEKIPTGAGYTIYQLPMPDSVLPSSIQTAVTTRLLKDPCLKGPWFSPLPIDLWVDFISQHSFMNSSSLKKKEDELFRLRILSTLSLEYERCSSVSLEKQKEFGALCFRALKDKQCIPFVSAATSSSSSSPSKQQPSSYSSSSVDFPTNLYLNSSELKAFDGLGNFHKVSPKLKNDYGISDHFLMSLGVRKSVAIEILFTNLDTLRWSDNPQPLIEYLRSATLTTQDKKKLMSTQYLPCENDSSRMYSPPELYLPNNELRIFPFLQLLQWPSSSSDNPITEESPDGKFLCALGMKVLPPLKQVLQYISSSSKEVHDDSIRVLCLDFVTKRFGSGNTSTSSYSAQYHKMSKAEKTNLKFLPCVVLSPLLDDKETTTTRRRSLYSVYDCFSDERCAVMGFPVIDPMLLGEDKAKLYGKLFQCAPEPNPNVLTNKLLTLVKESKELLDNSLVIQIDKSSSSSSANHYNETSERILNSFRKIFLYLSKRDLSSSLLSRLQSEDFIPCMVDNTIVWFKPNEVFFEKTDFVGDEQGRIDDDNVIHESLFQTVPFSPFLASVGVKQEASIKDIFRRLIESPHDILSACGNSEAKYKQILRRIAASTSSCLSLKNLTTQEIKESPFLLAYSISMDESKDDRSPSSFEEEKEKTNFELAKASDIYIIDNSFFGRMFPGIKRAPHESDLEHFYALIGSKYISKEVDKKYHVIGEAQKDTKLTRALLNRINERGPLLVSPSITSRPLVSNAASLIESQNLNLYQAPDLRAVYSLNNQSVRSQRITCCSIMTKSNQMRVVSFVVGNQNSSSSLYVTSDFDWFDVGTAIGELILQRCQLEDAFFISSLLEAPLEQLRARGFPVDRIIMKPQILKQKQAQSSVVTGTANTVHEEEKTSYSTTTSDSSSPPNSVKDATAITKKENENYVKNLKQMFPDSDEIQIRERLGENPTLEDVQAMAEEMMVEGYEKEEKEHQHQQQRYTTPPTSKQSSSSNNYKLFGSKKLGNALNGLMGTSAINNSAQNFIKQQLVQAQGALHNNNAVNHTGQQAQEKRRRRNNDPKSLEMEAMNHNAMEDQLKRKIQQSRNVNVNGIQSEERIESIPQDLDHDDCEIIPAQNLKAFSESHNGIQIFSSKKNPYHQKISDGFLRFNLDAVESFAVILEHLSCHVFDLKLSSVAIYHDPSGQAIAFNSNSALYFNVHFYCALHHERRRRNNSACYSYWFITFCHELAHNHVSAHNRHHAFYTESYSTMYLPKLMSFLSRIT